MRTLYDLVKSVEKLQFIEYFVVSGQAGSAGQDLAAAESSGQVSTC